MKHGTYTKIAKAIGLTESGTRKITWGERNASAPIADRLASLTGTDIRVWLKGGNPAERRATVQSLGESS